MAKEKAAAGEKAPEKKVAEKKVTEKKEKKEKAPKVEAAEAAPVAAPPPKPHTAPKFEKIAKLAPRNKARLPRRLKKAQKKAARGL